MEFTLFGRSIPYGERFFQETLDQCSHLRANAAHFSGHLPIAKKQKCSMRRGLYHLVKSKNIPCLASLGGWLLALAPRWFFSVRRRLFCGNGYLASRPRQLSGNSFQS